MQGQDSLAHYQHDIMKPHVARPDLLPHLAVHALRKVPEAHHVIRKTFSQQSYPVTQVKPQAFNNDGKMQLMLN